MSAPVYHPGSMKPNPNFTHLKQSVPSNRVTLLQGGTRSGKTWSVIYYLIWLCREYSGMEIDIVRDTFTALKATVWKDFKKILVDSGLYDVRNHNKTDHIYTLNGNVINYYGADNPEKIHGRSRDVLWINEAQHMDDETVDQLMPRTKYRVIADYNPALPHDHWLDRYIPEYKPFITTYRDNPHLTKEQVDEIESRMGNDYWWKVYGSGERAQPVGAIFTNWSITEFDQSLPFIFGMDFGYSNDPTTLVKIAIDERNKIIYTDECLYAPSLTTTQIYNILTQHVNRDDLIVADSAEPRLIDEIKFRGLNIKAAVKGPDSVRAGIFKMQDYKIVTTELSTNLQKELNNYTWNDKRSGTPVDTFNHAIDAVRYAFMYLKDQPNKGKYYIS